MSPRVRYRRANPIQYQPLNTQPSESLRLSTSSSNCSTSRSTAAFIFPSTTTSASHITSSVSTIEATLTTKKLLARSTDTFHTLVSTSNSGSPSIQSTAIKTGQLDPNNLPPASDPAFARRKEYWRTSYDRGTRLWKQLQQALATIPANNQCPNLQPTWQIQRVTDTQFTVKHGALCTDGGLFHILDRHDERDNPICADTGYHLYQQTTQERMPQNLENVFNAFNWYSAESNIIVAASNRLRIDPEDFSYKPGSKRPLGTPDIPISEWPRAPNSWADIAFASWNHVCSEAGTLPSDLLYVAQTEVVNQATWEVVWDAWEFDHRSEPDDEYAVLDYTEKDPDFYALLGSPNGVGVTRMLTKYANQFATRRDRRNPERITELKTVSNIFFQLATQELEADIVYGLYDDPPPPNFRGAQGPAVQARPFSIPPFSSRRPYPWETTTRGTHTRL